MAYSEKELLDLKEEILQAKTSVSELTGQQTALMNQFKEEWKCSTVQDVETKLKQLQKTIKSLDSQIEESSTELEKLLEENE
jgi:hypothetical protein